MGSIRIRNSEKLLLYPDYIILDSQHDFWRGPDPKQIIPDSGTVPHLTGSGFTTLILSKICFLGS